MPAQAAYRAAAMPCTATALVTLQTDRLIGALRTGQQLGYLVTALRLATALKGRAPQAAEESGCATRAALIVDSGEIGRWHGEDPAFASPALPAPA